MIIDYRRRVGGSGEEKGRELRKEGNESGIKKKISSLRSRVCD